MRQSTKIPRRQNALEKHTSAIEAFLGSRIAPHSHHWEMIERCLGWTQSKVQHPPSWCMSRSGRKPLRRSTLVTSQWDQWPTAVIPARSSMKSTNLRKTHKPTKQSHSSIQMKSQWNFSTLTKESWHALGKTLTSTSRKTTSQMFEVLLPMTKSILRPSKTRHTTRCCSVKLEIDWYSWRKS